VAVVTEVREPLVRLDHRLPTLSTPESVSAAGDGGEDVVGVHGAQDEGGSVPLGLAEPAAKVIIPALETGHTHRTQVLGASIHSHRNAVPGVLTRGQEEGAIQ